MLVLSLPLHGERNPHGLGLHLLLKAQPMLVSRCSGHSGYCPVFLFFYVKEV